MPNPAAFLSASAGLSAMLGGTLGAKTVTGNAGSSVAGGVATNGAANGAIGPGFSAFLASQTTVTTASAAKATAVSDDQASLDQPSLDQTAAACGKSLPFAALANAILPPVPITLSALGTTPTDHNATVSQDDTSAGAPDSASTNASAQAFALMAMAQGTTPATLATASPSTASDNTTAPMTPATTLAAAHIQGAHIQGADGNQAGANGPALPHPGFTLIPDAASAAQSATLAAVAPSASSSAASSASQPTVTMTAATALAMADPAHLAAIGARPGFTLLPDTSTSGASGDANGLGAVQTVASQQPSVTLSADMSVAMAPSTQVDTARFASAVQDSAVQTSTLQTSTLQGTIPNAAAIQMAQADGTLAAMPATLTTSASMPSIKLATARGGTAQVGTAQVGTAQGKVATVTMRGSTKNAAQADTPASAPYQDDAIPSSSHSPVSPSADGVSMPDNAPSSILPLTSVGTVAVAQTLVSASVATDGAATLSSPQQTGQHNGTDMAALVDRLVEARAAARSGFTTQSVQASVTHADFGRVSLRFNQDDDGLSVSMTSRDPGFAPAAQAALAQAPQVAASAQSQSANQQGTSQQNSGQAGQHWAQAGAGNTGSNSAGGQTWNQGGQNGAPYAQTHPEPQARAIGASTSTATTARTRGGILA